MPLADPDGIELGRYIMALALVLGLVLISGWGLRRWRLPGFSQAGDRSSRLRLVHSRMIDPKTRVAIVACDNREFCLVLGAGYCTPLGETGGSEFPTADPMPASDV